MMTKKEYPPASSAKAEGENTNNIKDLSHKNITLDQNVGEHKKDMGVHPKEGRRTVKIIKKGQKGMGKQGVGVCPKGDSFFDQLTPTANHLPYFSDLDKASGLYGNDYLILKKGLWYHLHGGNASHKIIQIGQIYTDTRFNLLCPLPSGTGKKGLAMLIRDISKNCEKICYSPTSFHSEQLVGKMIRLKEEYDGENGKKEFKIRSIPNYGYLKGDFILFDDANILLTAKENVYEESRRYVTQALDPIGRNTISKKLVDDFPSNTLSYDPEVSISLFIQPIPLPAEVVLSGFVRRFMIIYVPLFGTMVERTEELKERLYSTENREEALFNLKVHFNYVYSIVDSKLRYPYTFHDDVLRQIELLMRELGKIGKQHSQYGRHYTDRVFFSLQDILIKMACIQAISCYRTEINEIDVRLAYLDLFEFFLSSLEYIDKKVMGELDYGETWHGATSTDATCLKYLLEKGAVSKEESKISIKQFIAFIGESKDIKEVSARSHYRRFVRRGWIDSKQVGSQDTRVWLAIKPKEEFLKDIKPETIQWEETEYFKISEHLDDLIKERESLYGTSTHPVHPYENDLDSAKEELVGSESVTHPPTKRTHPHDHHPTFRICQVCGEPKDNAELEQNDGLCDGCMSLKKSLSESSEGYDDVLGGCK